LIQEIGLLFFEHGYFQDPKTGLVPVYLDEVVLVIAAQDELAEELHFPFVLSLSLQLVDIGGAQVFDPFGQFLFIEQYFVNADEQLVRPVCIELAAETIISQIGHVIVKDGLKPFQKSTLACGTFLGN
tara:strand:- start:34475 stop:34858 length:384 start_codon:yes stop_codon:yes gene_type:complete